LLKERLKYLRENLGLSQSQVAIKLNLSRVNYNRYEKGGRTPDNETLKRIAGFYNVTTDYLLGLDTQATQQATEKKKIKDLIEFLKQPEVLFDDILLTEEDKAKVKASLEIVFWDAKQKKKREQS
jgi:transcriptional regulator with XRE-family HTH domain